MTTAYPTALDDTTGIINNATNDTLTADVHPAQHNNVSDAIIAIETELGTLPKGSYADVKTRLNDGVIKTPGADQIVRPSGDFVGLAIRSAVGQNTANLFETRNTGGTTLVFIDRNGVLSAQTLKINGTALASTHLSDGTSLALLASPVFTGNPTAPTQTAGNNTTRLATTAFVTTAVAAVTVPVTSVFGRTGAVVSATNDYTDLQVQNSPTNKLTTTGDVLYASAANTLARLAVGSTGAALRVASGLPSWKTLASAGASLGTYELTGTNGAVAGMLGMGMTITPTSTGVVVVHVTSAYGGGWTNCFGSLQFSFGTGTPPVNSAGFAGTLIGGAVSTSPAGNNAMSFALSIRLSGLTVGTTYWFDLYENLSVTQDDQHPGLIGGNYVITEVG